MKINWTEWEQNHGPNTKNPRCALCHWIQQNKYSITQIAKQLDIARETIHKHYCDPLKGWKQTTRLKIYRMTGIPVHLLPFDTRGSITRDQRRALNGTDR